jgi:hypothetical protein
MNNKYNLKDYEEILETLRDIEKREAKSRMCELIIGIISIVASLVCIIRLIALDGFSDLFTSEAVGSLLVLLFNSLYFSYKEEIYSERKDLLYQALIDVLTQKSTDENIIPVPLLEIDQIKEWVNDLIKVKF